MKITQAQFDALYLKYYYCFGVSFQHVQTGVNNDTKKAKVRKKLENYTSQQRQNYYNLVQEVVDQYLIGKKLNLSKLLESNNYTSDLSGLNLSDKDFSGVYFGGINLSKTDFRKCRFFCDKKQEFYEDFLQADFTGAIFSETDFRGADIKFTGETRGYSHTALGISEEHLKNRHIIINPDQVVNKYKDIISTQKTSINDFLKKHDSDDDDASDDKNTNKKEGAFTLNFDF